MSKPFKSEPKNIGSAVEGERMVNDSMNFNIFQYEESMFVPVVDKKKERTLLARWMIVVTVME